MTRPRQFLDALSGPDGTQALQARYVAPPVYPDASLGVIARPVPVRRPPPVRVTVPPAALVVPELPAALAQLAAPLQRPVQPRQVRRTTPLVAGGVPAAPYGMPVAPSRQQAASAAYYQGPAPTAVAPAAASLHNMPMSYASQQSQRVLQPASQPAAFAPPPPVPATNRPPAATPAPYGPPTGFAPPPANRPQRQPIQGRPRRRTSWIQGVIALIIFGLIGTGLGAKLVAWLEAIFER